ncbi:PDGLE domain-containing protein [Cohnella lupini]|jgi:cobalt/nickel transport protein|uniref:Cobalt/nickel transport protein n=1 Tax=Cohnella lupini TaxID=1294267 RepID=A0A3D9HVV9_9BACL|nr:PDGLE domain-containing protein [Cohnella lupini]RED53046.1 cobalt/nickel transport protein [Cohnella lupini]
MSQQQPVEVVTNKKRRWLVMAIVTVVAAGVISYFASPHPDGLERVAENHGFIDQAKTPSWTAWIPDYEVPGIKSPILKVGLAGVIGVAALFGVLYALTRPLARRREADNHGKGDHHPS